MDAHADWIANVTIMQRTPEYHREHLDMLEEQVKNIKHGEEDDVHEQLKKIEGDVNLLLKKTVSNGKLMKGWEKIVGRVNSLVDHLKTLKLTYPRQRGGG